MKFTSKQLMEAMGLKPLQEFKVDGYLYKARFSADGSCIEYNEGRKDWFEDDLGPTDILNIEITILPHYTLTEREKYLIASIKLGDDNEMYVYKLRHGTHIGNRSYVALYLHDDMFECIPFGEKVSLDELRKCL